MAFSIFGKTIGFSRIRQSKPTLERAPATAPPVAPKGELDFSTYNPSRSSNVRRASSAEPETKTTSAATEVAAAERAASIIEDTVILFANGQAEQALATLARAVRGENLGSLALQGWLMLFDLYQHLGMAVEFEVLAMKFTVRFERSPPTWLEVREHRRAELDSSDIGAFALGRALTVASAPELEKLRDAAVARRTLHVECGEVERFDGPGCGLLRDALALQRVAGGRIQLSGEGRLRRLLEDVCQPKKLETDGAVWALLFEIYRILDLKEKFVDAAVNYAVTYEVSPPSWESAQGTEARARPPEAPYQVLALAGELTGASEDLAKLLRDSAAANDMLVIDISKVRRVDFVTAGLIFKVLSKLGKDGTTIQIRGASELIHALFSIMGIDKVARITPLK